MDTSATAQQGTATAGATAAGTTAAGATAAGATAAGATAAGTTPVTSQGTAAVATPVATQTTPAGTSAVATPVTTGLTTPVPTSTGTKVAKDGIVIDKSKTQAEYITDAEKKYIIPSLVREKFPDLIKLIYETESMNDEEREYWMQIMPIMTEDQIVKFREILVNEKQQLQKLDLEYQQEMRKLNQVPVKEINEKELKEKMATIKTAEANKETQEQNDEADILDQIQNV